MDAFTRHTLVKSAMISGLEVLEKSASASPQQYEVLDQVWPDGSREQVSNMEALSRIYAGGLMVEESEQAAQAG
jgi:hypothetical protein